MSVEWTVSLVSRVFHCLHVCGHRLLCQSVTGVLAGNLVSIESPGQAQVLSLILHVDAGCPPPTSATQLSVGPRAKTPVKPWPFPLAVCSFLNKQSGLNGNCLLHLLLLGIRNKYCPERDYNQKRVFVMDTFISCLFPYIVHIAHPQ